MEMGFRLGALLIAVALVACASAGRKVDRTHLDDVEEGMQTKSEIRAWFGEPYSMTVGLTGHLKGCVERWQYEYAKARGFGTITYQEVLVVDFDVDDKVCDHAYSKSGEE
jgi:outer membrane protein assembly factor BamE (lipoprotein component of BamABCDE complex)